MLRAFLSGLVGVLCAGGLALPIVAEPLVFEATLTLLDTVVGPREIASGSGVSEVTSSFGQLDEVRILGGNVLGSTAVPVTDPLVSNGGLVKVEITAELPLSQSTRIGFDPFGGPFASAVVTQGTLPLRGERRNCLLFLDCNPGARQTLPFATPGQGVGYGVGGIITVGGTGTVRISLVGAPFELGPVTLSNPTLNGAVAPLRSDGFVHGPLSNSFSGAHTVGGAGGGFQLVSPVRTLATGASGPGFGGHFVRLDVQFVPEPRLAVGLGTSAALLLAIARSRAKR